MPNQEESNDGKPRVDRDRPSADVERYATDGQSDARGKGASDEQGEFPPRSAERPLERRTEPYEGDGPGKVGLTSDQQPDLVAPSGVNQGDHGVAEDKPMAGDTVNFDDDDENRPRGNTTRTGGTWDAQGGDSGALSGEGERKGPGAGLSNRNGPSDPDAKNERPAG
ncbi:hypothetical protein [Ramlibacter tataouinensis]|uniref:Uncharacterized protein n=1 Tax=Ramlibacter tataouinensis (strain ATCC BAA-407 / DSM 14655 / LMG 21543 / TTB310) TaxID=365046 RepID=F5Y2M2_RAMTT|nr:hypothetical protein [Ramlibacter tataouinensis]AEG92385.1 hypothetical protein Rta_12980 [Ramlibacter tataouinensis TTB310]